MIKSIRKQAGFFGISGSVIASAVGAGLSYLGSRQNNSDNIQNAQNANYTNIELANTAHQREVADLTAAGLNPILSANHSGSATPTQIVPQITSPLGAAATSARDTFDTYNKGRKIDTEIKEANQSMRVKEPLAKIGDLGSQGVDFAAQSTGDAIKGALEYVLGDPSKQGDTGLIGHIKDWGENVLGGLQSTAEKIGDIASGASAKAIEGLHDTSQRFSDKMSEVVQAPQKYIGQRVASAKEYYDRATQPGRPVVGTKIIDVNGKKEQINPHSFSGTNAENMNAIKAIKNPQTRAYVMNVYKQWQYNYQK